MLVRLPTRCVRSPCLVASGRALTRAILDAALSRPQENVEKIKLNNQLPYLVSNIVEVLDVDPEEDEEEDGERRCNACLRACAWGMRRLLHAGPCCAA